MTKIALHAARLVCALMSAAITVSCATTSSDIEAAGIDKTIELSRSNTVAIAKCTQFQLLSQNPGAIKQVSRGIGDHAEISESNDQARVWGPATGYPMYSIEFTRGKAQISAQAMLPYSKAEIVAAIVPIIVACDQAN